MKINGLGNWKYVCAWFVNYFIMLFISSLLIVILLKIGFNNGMSIVPQSSGLALFFCLIAYSTVTICYCLMMAAIFSDSETVVPVAGIVWLFTYVPYLACSLRVSHHTNFELMMCFFCNTVLGLLFNQVIELEKLSTGLKIYSFFKYIPADPKMTCATYILVLYLLSFLYIVVAILVEDFRFEKFNIFIKLNSFFHSKKTKRYSAPTRTNLFNRETVVFEIEPANRNILIKVENLSKQFTNEEYAVKRLNVNFYEGDVTVLVGHNGSGKTTLLELIGGVLPKTSGHIFIEGVDVDKQNSNVRKNFGIYLNEDCLFPNLNAIDHLIFFARLRGISSLEIKDEVLKYLNVMQLGSRKNRMVQKLSQNEQRFLAVCCAFVGRSKIILLDEPSKGLDHIKMKSLWELIQHESKERTIILTSHNEQEIEALANKIGILCGGELKCFGSGFFLKKVYGQGQRLVCYKGEGFRKDNLMQLIQSHIPYTSIESEYGKQISYILDDIAAIANLCDDLENNKEELGVAGISISEMNVSDIFFIIEALRYNDGDQRQLGDIRSGHFSVNKGSPTLQLQNDSLHKFTGFQLFLNHCEVMFYKRLTSSYRIYVPTLLQLIMPFLITIASFSLLNIGQEREPLETISYELYQYPRSITTYEVHQPYTTNEKTWRFFYAYEEQLLLQGINHKMDKVPDNETGISAYLLRSESNFDELVNIEYLVGFSADNDFLTAFFNNFPLHTVPLTLQLAYNAVLRSNNFTGRLMTTFDPLPISSKEGAILEKFLPNVGIYLAFNISVCVGLTWPLGIMYLVREKRNNFKFFQQFCGVRKWVFWINCFIFDIIFIVITTLIIELAIVIYDVKIFEEEKISGSYFLILVIAGICMCPSNYLMSLIRDDPQMAYAKMAVFNTIGSMSFWAYFEVYKKGYRKLDGDTFKSIMQIFPHFSLCHALMKTFKIAEQEKLCEDKTTKLISVVLDNCDKAPKCCRKIKSFNKIFLWSAPIMFILILLSYFIRDMVGIDKTYALTKSMFPSIRFCQS